MSIHCMQCSAELETVPELQAHMKDIHINQRNQDLKLDPDKLAEIEHSKKADEIPPPPILPPQPVALPPPEPITLEYKYKGQCEVCRSPIKTIQIELGEHYMMTAYCVSCDKTKCQILTIPIEKQNDYTESVRTNNGRTKNA